ncbi:hypothetical protein ACFC1I_03340 [Microbacterium sp. NPDC056044]|uniref:hypothetical protein n=1 Tax=Microbacterium sp. NPDC056044 TaxID=3345690 RepID=UPI0035E22C30
MTARITEDEWTPLPGALPGQISDDIVYVIPTRTPVSNDDEADKVPRYTDQMRYFPREARNSEPRLPVEFSIPSGSRKFISEYSIDPDVWALGLAVLTMSNDWLIFVTQAFIDMRGRAQGWAPEQAQQLPLKISIVETKSSRTVEIEGKGSEVIEAIRELNVKGKSKGKGKG